MKEPTLILPLAIALLSGCATQIKTMDYYDLPTESLNNLRAMTQLPELALSDENYTDVGVVTGLSCRRNTAVDPESGSPASENIAMDQLKLKAAALGADHITTPQCVRSDKMDLSNNCWSTLICTSHALKVVAIESGNQI